MVSFHGICVVSLLCSVFLTLRVGAFDSTAVTNTLQSALDCQNKPGLAVGVVKDGQLIYSQGFGVTDLESRRPITDETLFSIASVSKSFTAALFVKLLHEKTNLTLESKVREYFGEGFIMPDLLRTHETTFIDLLAHRTGMLYNNYVRLDDTFNRDTLISRLRYLPTDHQFRTDYFQNKLLYGLLAKTCEMMDGDKEWETLVTEHLFQPLGMDKSTFNIKLDFSREDLARGYEELDGPGIQQLISEDTSRLWGGMWGSSSIVSSAKDMAKWMNFHLYGGKNNRGDQVMDETLVGYRLLAHTGGLPGYKNYMALLPDKKIGVIAMMTGSEQSFRRRVPIVHYLLDSALGVEPYLNQSTICSYPNPWIPNQLVPAYRPTRTDVPLRRPTEQYEGVFSNAASTSIEIGFNESLSSLNMKFGWGRWQLLVLPQSGHNNGDELFYMKGIEPRFPPDFKPISFIVHPNDAEVVIGIKATAFESKLPPIFCKRRYLTICEGIAKKRLPKEDYSYFSYNKGASRHYKAVDKIYIFSLILVTMQPFI